MATKQKAGYKKKAAKKGSKKAVSRKKTEDDGNDPPIIVSGGGGGVGIAGKKRKGKNQIQVSYTPKGGTSSPKHPAKVNGDTMITAAKIEFPGMAGIEPITLKDYESYTIKITFHTSD